MRQRAVGPDTTRPRDVDAANQRTASGDPHAGQDTGHASSHEERSAPRAPPPRCIEYRVFVVIEINPNEIWFVDLSENNIFLQSICRSDTLV